MANFIYVFNEEARDKLLDMQFKMLKSDKNNHIYIFVNDGKGNFSIDDISYVLSNTLTF